MFCLHQTLYFFWLLTLYHAEKYFKMFECCSRARLSASTSSQFTFGVRNPRQNYVIHFHHLLWLGFGGWQSYYKSYKLARKWTMFTDSYLLSVMLLTGVHTTNAGYSCSGRILQTQARLWLERAWWRSRCDQRKIAMLEEVEKKIQTKDYRKVVKAQFNL